MSENQSSKIAQIIALMDFTLDPETDPSNDEEVRKVLHELAWQLVHETREEEA